MDHNYKRMKLSLYGWIFVAFAGAIAIGVGWYLLLPKPASAPAQHNPVTLPGSGTAPVVEQPAATQIKVPDQQGAAVTVLDFLHNGTTVADPANAGNYYLASQSADGFSIGYRLPAQFFTIALEREPIGQTRAAAETYLLKTLGVTKMQLCNLNYYLGTDVHTNEQYAGRNLGFSFCPGATPLPQ